jgi:hypothetical protein
MRRVLGAGTGLAAGGFPVIARRELSGGATTGAAVTVIACDLVDVVIVGPEAVRSM